MDISNYLLGYLTVYNFLRYGLQLYPPPTNTNSFPCINVAKCFPALWSAQLGTFMVTYKHICWVNRCTITKLAISDFFGDWFLLVTQVVHIL